MAEVPLCDVCGRPIMPEPGLWDRQGQLVEVRFGAYTQRVNLCSDDIKQLDWVRELGVRLQRGTLPVQDAYGYMPNADLLNNAPEV